jgi:DNA-binding MarR family transcriptional regulator
MRIERNQTICGLTAFDIRSLLRRIMRLPGAITLQGIADTLGMEQARARRVIESLERAGYVERQQFPGEKCWINTMKGNQLALATAAKPIRRTTAERILAALLERVQEVNRSLEFTYRVAEVRIFGSYLTDADTLGDIDVVITLTRRFLDPDEQFTWERKRIVAAQMRGRRFRNISDEVSWPQHEVLLFLKARSRSLSFHGPSDRVLNMTESQVIFSMK